MYERNITVCDNAVLSPTYHFTPVKHMDKSEFLPQIVEEKQIKSSRGKNKLERKGYTHIPKRLSRIFQLKYIIMVVVTRPQQYHNVDSRILFKRAFKI